MSLQWNLWDRLSRCIEERASLAARVAELEARCKRLEEVGDMIVDEYMVVEPEKSAWKQAKETKP